MEIKLKFIKMLLALAYTCCTFASEPVRKEFLGTYEGSGRSCYGTLRITPHIFSWKTTFKSIKSTSYEVVEQSISESHLKLVIKIKKPMKAWGLPIILLECDRNNSEYAWNATAYKSENDYRQDNHDNLSCLVFKK